MNGIARKIGLSTLQMDQSFVPAVSGKDWTTKLMQVLRKGIGSMEAN